MLAVTVDGRAGFGKGKVFALILHTGIARCGKVPYMDFPDNRIGLIRTGNPLIVFPTNRVGAVQIKYHASHTVDTGRTGININGFFGGAVAGYQISVVGTVQIAADGDRPYTLTALSHILGFDDGGAGFGITAGLVAFDLHL